MKLQFPKPINWIDFLRFKYGYDHLTVSMAQELHQALCRAESDLGAVLGPEYAGMKARNMECRLRIRAMCQDPLNTWTGTIEARLILIRHYADRQRLHFHLNPLTNRYESTNPTTHSSCLHGSGRPRNDEPVAVPI